MIKRITIPMLAVVLLSFSVKLKTYRVLTISPQAQYENELNTVGQTRQQLVDFGYRPMLFRNAVGLFVFVNVPGIQKYKVEDAPKIVKNARAEIGKQLSVLSNNFWNYMGTYGTKWILHKANVRSQNILFPINTKNQEIQFSKFGRDGYHYLGICADSFYVCIKKSGSLSYKLVDFTNSETALNELGQSNWLYTGLTSQHMVFQKSKSKISYKVAAISTSPTSMAWQEEFNKIGKDGWIVVGRYGVHYIFRK
jgi:hypothetical protein